GRPSADFPAPEPVLASRIRAEHADAMRRIDLLRGAGKRNGKLVGLLVAELGLASLAVAAFATLAGNTIQVAGGAVPARAGVALRPTPQRLVRDAVDARTAPKIDRATEAASDLRWRARWLERGRTAVSGEAAAAAQAVAAAWPTVPTEPADTQPIDMRTVLARSKSVISGQADSTPADSPAEAA
ncbi:MAG: hypothetical protein ACTH31_14655, partial [Pseudoclavibacter sp.]